jgi:hypothetical protein
MVFCYILWTFGVVRGILVYFSRFGILHQEKSGNPAQEIGTKTAAKEALAAWRSGHRIRHRNRRPGFESRLGIRFKGKHRTVDTVDCRSEADSSIM